MPVKKSSAAKKATAKKTTTSRTAAKKTAAPAKKTAAKKTAAKKTTAKKSASASGDGPDFERIGAALVKHIESGNMDGVLRKIDAAVTKRISDHIATQNSSDSASTKSTSEKRVSDAPKRSTSKREASVEKPEKNKTYQIKANVKKLGGAKVKFLKHSVKNPEKSVVEMVDSKPGYPKGKQILVLTAGLTNPKK